jgi:hypothetical protein
MKHVSFLFAALVRNIPLRDQYLAGYVQFQLETHTDSREIDFYCVVEAACISHLPTKQVHFFFRQISYSTLVEGANNFEQDKLAVNVKLVFLCSGLKSWSDYRLRYVFFSFFKFLKVIAEVVPSKKLIYLLLKLLPTHHSLFSLCIIRHCVVTLKNLTVI